MTLKNLRIFKEVCDLNSVTKAAESLYMAQPAVSFALSEIERHYGVLLFQRIGKKLVITEQGQALYERACAVIDAFEDFEKEANSVNTKNTVVMGTSLTVGTFILPKILTEAKKLYPDIRIKSKIFSTSIIESMTMQGKLDFGLVESSLSSPSLCFTKFSRDRLVSFAANDYPAPPFIKIKDFHKYNFILREKGSATRDCLEQYFKENKVDIPIAIETASPQAAISLSVAGHGIAILPYGMVSNLIERKLIKIIELEKENFERSYYIVSLKRKIMTDAQKKIYGLCMNYQKL